MHCKGDGEVSEKPWSLPRRSRDFLRLMARSEEHVPLAQILLNGAISRSTGKAPFGTPHGYGYLRRLKSSAQVVKAPRVWWLS